MAKIFSVVPLELRLGVRDEDFVRFWLEEFALSVGEGVGSLTCSKLSVGSGRVSMRSSGRSRAPKRGIAS